MSREIERIMKKLDEALIKVQVTVCSTHSKMLRDEHKIRQPSIISRVSRSEHAVLGKTKGVMYDMTRGGIDQIAQREDDQPFARSTFRPAPMPRHVAAITDGEPSCQLVSREETKSEGQPDGHNGMASRFFSERPVGSPYIQRTMDKLKRRCETMRAAIREERLRCHAREQSGAVQTLTASATVTLPAKPVLIALDAPGISAVTRKADGSSPGLHPSTAQSSDVSRNETVDSSLRATDNMELVLKIQLVEPVLWESDLITTSVVMNYQRTMTAEKLQPGHATDCMNTIRCWRYTEKALTGSLHFSANDVSAERCGDEAVVTTSDHQSPG